MYRSSSHFSAILFIHLLEPLWPSFQRSFLDSIFASIVICPKLCCILDQCRLRTKIGRVRCSRHKVGEVRAAVFQKIVGLRAAQRIVVRSENSIKLGISSSEETILSRAECFFVGDKIFFQGDFKFRKAPKKKTRKKNCQPFLKDPSSPLQNCGFQFSPLFRSSLGARL